MSRFRIPTVQPTFDAQFSLRKPKTSETPNPAPNTLVLASLNIPKQRDKKTELYEVCERAQYACSSCKTSKYKCVLSDISNSCIRCLSSGNACIFPPAYTSLLMKRRRSKICSSDDVDSKLTFPKKRIINDNSTTPSQINCDGINHVKTRSSSSDSVMMPAQSDSAEQPNKTAVRQLLFARPMFLVLPLYFLQLPERAQLIADYFNGRMMCIFVRQIIDGKKSFFVRDEDELVLNRIDIQEKWTALGDSSTSIFFHEDDLESMNRFVLDIIMNLSELSELDQDRELCCLKSFTGVRMKLRAGGYAVSDGCVMILMNNKNKHFLTMICSRLILEEYSLSPFQITGD